MENTIQTTPVKLVIRIIFIVSIVIHFAMAILFKIGDIKATFWPTFENPGDILFHYSSFVMLFCILSLAISGIKKLERIDMGLLTIAVIISTASFIWNYT